MSSLNLDRLKFDPADLAEGPLVGSYIISDGGEVITHTTDGAKERLDVNAQIDALANPEEFGLYNEDAAHGSGDLGSFVMAVQTATQGALADDGDYAPFQVDGEGRLRVVADIDLTGDLVGDDEADTEDPLKVGSHAYDQSSALGALSAAGDKANLASDLYRRVFINDGPNVGGSNEAVSVDTTAGGVALGTPSAGRTRMIIQNQGDKSIYIGFGTVTAANGIEIGKGDNVALEVGESIALKAIAASGTQDVRVLHWG